MKNLLKQVRLGTVPTYDGRRVSIFCDISYKDGRLSITGVIGPKSNGDAWGSCGQCDSSIREDFDKIEFAEGWSPELAGAFLGIWDTFHLNDMKPYDAEMKAAGWPKLASIPMHGYHFSLTKEAWDARQAAKKAAMNALRNGETFTPTPDQVAAVSRPLSYVKWTYADEPEPVASDGYERHRETYGHNKGNLRPVEHKTLGWLRPDDHPDGLLTRKLREDGPGYGSAWFREDVPEEVLQFLQGLPDADKPSPWGRPKH